MNSLNRVQLIGHLGKDPELIVGKNDFKVAKVSIATTSGYKDKASGEWKEITEWNNISFYNQQAEYVSKYLKKGYKIYIEGKLTTRSYDNAQGAKSYFTEVKVEQFINLTAKEKPAENAYNNQAAEQYQYNQNNEPKQDENNEDLPF